MRIGVCVVSLLLLGSTATAEPLVWTVNGTITEITGDGIGSNLALLLSPGEGFTVDFPISPGPDLCDSPASGLYETPGATISLLGASYTASATFWEVNNMAGSCLVASPGIVTRSVFDNAPFALMTLGWGTTTFEHFPTEIEGGFAWFAEVGWTPTVFADIRPEIEASTVPEPATGLLLLTGLAAIRRRRSRNV